MKTSRPSGPGRRRKREVSPPTPARRSYARFTEKLRADGSFDEWGPFVSGGPWKGFLTKYEESNLMVRKMMRVSAKLERARQAARLLDGANVGARGAGDAPAVPDAGTLDEARRELWRGQCNCAYWHGVFGGLYLPHLRSAVYEHLIRAEGLLDGVRGDAWDEVEILDHDLDGFEEIVLESRETAVYVAPSRGGSIFELDVRRANWNVLATMASYEEAYHDEVLEEGGEGLRSIHDGVVAKEKGLERLVAGDVRARAAAVDRFLPADARPADVRRARAGEGADSRCAFRLARQDGSVGVVMRADTVAECGGRWPVAVEKRVRLVAPGGVSVEYTLTPGTDLDVLFTSEWNLAFLTASKEWVAMRVGGGKRLSLAAEHAFEGVGSVVVEDRLRGESVRLACEPDATVWSWPLETASQSEGGLERVFQGLTLVTVWPLRAAAGEPVNFTVRFSALPLEG